MNSRLGCFTAAKPPQGHYDPEREPLNRGAAAGANMFGTQCRLSKEDADAFLSFLAADADERL